MKKFYFLASVLLASMTINAQEIVNFDELELEPESFYNGADLAMSFTSNNIIFNSAYNAEWGIMSSGFAYSNITDNVTADFTNEYSAIVGAGADNSANYAINYGGDTLFLPHSHVKPISIDITNTTYAYYSMKDGDAFAKQFGSPLNASNEIDGTDGKDFFYITVNGHTASGEIVNSLDIYLADFRSDNEEEHYILNEWTTFDLSEIGEVNYLTFEYNSSDIGEWGMNTPMYFALDNFEYNPYVSGLAKNTLPTFEVYPNPTQNSVNIKGESGNYSITDLNGKTVMIFEVNQMNTVDVSALNSGVYLIKNNKTSTTQKLIIQ